jgi:sulfoxide reductase heme-binding subunit YedZ
MTSPTPSQLTFLRTLLFFACLLPAGNLMLAWQHDTLGANPIESLTHATGDWTLRLLLITLSITPLRHLTGWHWLVRLRRMLGLFTFAYASAHFLIYLWLDQFFDWHSIAADIMKRPFVTVGFAAFVLLIPLAATSTHGAMRRLGGRRWQALHRSIYGIAILALLHFWWLTKADYLEPAIYSLILLALLGARAWWREQERRRQLSAIPAPPKFKSKVIHIVPK